MSALKSGDRSARPTRERWQSACFPSRTTKSRASTVANIAELPGRIVWASSVETAPGNPPHDAMGGVRHEEGEADKETEEESGGGPLELGKRLHRNRPRRANRWPGDRGPRRRREAGAYSYRKRATESAWAHQNPRCGA